MKMRHGGLLAALVVAGCSSGSHGSTSGGSSGSGGSTGGGVPCGSVTAVGQCQGPVLEYCDPTKNTLTQLDCAQVAPPDAGEVFSCELIDAAYGYDCAAPSGGNCLETDSSGNTFPTFCVGSNVGCVLGPRSALCQSNLSPCVSVDSDAGFTFSGALQNQTACSANLLQVICNVDQPTAWDCAALGGTCGAILGGAACLNLPAGQVCDSTQFFCGTGTTCLDPDGGGATYCH